MSQKPTYEELERQVSLLKQAEAERQQTEEELRRNESRYRNLVENAPDLIYSYSLTRGGIFYNSQVESTLGYSPSYLLQNPNLWYDSIHPEDSHRVDAAIDAFQSGKSFEVEYRIKDSEGNWHWLLDRSISRTLDSGEMIIEGIATDITNRKKMEEDFTRLFSMSLDMVCIADIKTATFLNVNPMFTQVLGYSKETLLGRSFLDFVHPDDVDATQRTTEEQINGSKIINFENRYRCKDGSYRWFSWVSHPTPEQGVTYAIARDTTRRKQYEAALQSSKALLDASGRMAKVGGWELDVATMSVTWTEETYRIHELPLDDQVPLEKALTFYHPEDKPKLEQAIQRALDHGESYDLEFRFITAKGKHLWVRTICRPKIVDGKTVKLRGTFQDITTQKKMEEELRFSEIWMRSIFNALDECVLVVTPDRDLTDVNEATERVFGYTKEEITEQSTEILHVDSEHYKEFGRRINQAFAENRTAHFEFQAKRKNGEVFPTEHTVSRLKNDADETIGIVSVVTDITDRKLAEQTLKHEQKLLESMIEALPVLITRYDPNANMLLVNREFERVVGWSMEEVQQINLMAEVYPDPAYRQEAYRYMQETTTEWKEFQIRTKSGDIIDVEWSNIRLEDGTQIGIGVDVSERNRSFAAIKQAQERMQLAADAAQFGVWDLNVKENRLEWDDWMFRLYGVDRESFGGAYEAWQASMHPDDLERSSHEVELALRGEKQFDTGFRIVRPDGEMRHLKAYATVTWDSQGNPVQMTGINYDITEKKELEEQIQHAQKMEAIGNLAGGIAHDFNNVLTPVILMSEVLLKQLPPDSPARKHAERILKAGKRGSELVKQILMFSRRTAQQKIPTRIQTVIEEVLRLTRSTIPSYIEMEEEIQSDCKMVLADPTQIHQVAMNIITNAFHAVEAEGGKITVKLKERELSFAELNSTNLAPGHYAVLSISDTGHGISEDLVEKIFDPYFTTKEKGKGTGLGLAVVYGIVKASNGVIVVESEVGQGSTFTIYLPVIKDAPSPQPLASFEPYRTGTERILLVDDEEIVANVEKETLESLGYQVTMYTNSREALEAFKAAPQIYDLILTDMTMPKMTGDQFATEIKSIRPDIPIIVCTGFSEKIDEEKAKLLGIEGLLMKPVGLTEFADTVRRLLDDAKFRNKTGVIHER